LTSSASAQPFSDASPAAAQSTPAGPSAAVASDPNIDRAILQSTAMTQAAGTMTYNNYELILHGLTFGVTDNVQATLTVLSPISAEIPLVAFAALKGRLLSTSRVQVSIQGTVGYGHRFGGSDASAYTMGAGALASLCLRDDCSSLLSAAVNYQLAVDNSSMHYAHLAIYGGSLVHRLDSHVKLLAEVTSAAAGVMSASGEGNIDFVNMPGALFSYGLRFHTASIAGDVGFIKPVVKGNDGGFLMGFPFVSLSYRWQ
jgi:hypothetical protein